MTNLCKDTAKRLLTCVLVLTFYWMFNFRTHRHTSPGCYLAEWPVCALGQVDACTWTSDWLKSAKCTKFLIFMNGTWPSATHRHSAKWSPTLHTGSEQKITCYQKSLRMPLHCLYKVSLILFFSKDNPSTFKNYPFLVLCAFNTMSFHKKKCNKRRKAF